MKRYTYQNELISKKQLRQLLAWSFTTYNSMQACSLADELKHLGFRYATQSGISISIEDLHVPFIKNNMINTANQELTNLEKLYLKGNITNVERFQKIIDTWSLTSESLKTQIVSFFKHYDPLNSVYIMAFSGARGNLSQVRQLVGMRGLMSDPSGEIMNLPIKKNFREGLTITDYLMSGYGARKGIVDTALKTANSGYLTRRLIDVSQDIIIREKDCLTTYSIRVGGDNRKQDATEKNLDNFRGCLLNQPLLDIKTKTIFVNKHTQITQNLATTCKEKKINQFYLRSPLTCNLYRAVCQTCYGWDLATESLVDIGEAVGILAGQSIGEPGTQLTMRTFHTGGIFTSKTRQQIMSPISGIFQTHKLLKTVVLRTNAGEDVLVTRNSGIIIVIPDNPKLKITELKILPNTILFPKDNQFVSKDTVLGELINTNRQLKTEIKPILNDIDGETFVPKLKKFSNLSNRNQLVWLLFGKLFYSPIHSFLNFYPDYKIQQYNSVARSKVIAQCEGRLVFSNNEKSLHKHVSKLVNFSDYLPNTIIRNLETSVDHKNHVLTLFSSNYLISLRTRKKGNYLNRTTDGQVGYLISNKFKTLVGGQVFYDTRTVLNENLDISQLNYFTRFFDIDSYLNVIHYNTLVWLEEEIYKLTPDSDALFIQHGDFISSNFEISQQIFSKTSGFAEIKQKVGSTKIIKIKSGLVYESNTFTSATNQLYYPGEKIYSNIMIHGLMLCESPVEKKLNQLLLRSVKIYERGLRNVDHQQYFFSSYPFQSKRVVAYKSGQKIQSCRNVDLILDILLINEKQVQQNNLAIKLLSYTDAKIVRLQLIEKLQFTNYIIPFLKYRNLETCVLGQKNQFFSKYTIFAYLETITDTSIEIIKIKIKQKHKKQIFVISNTDCTTVLKKDLPNNKLDDLITTSLYIKQLGKIIIENKESFTIQKGQPYFFPNCTNLSQTVQSNIEYKILLTPSPPVVLQIPQKIFVDYCDLAQLSTRNFAPKNKVTGLDSYQKINFSKFILKRNGKLYMYMMPQFFKKFFINKESLPSSFPKLVHSLVTKNTDAKDIKKKKKEKSEQLRDQVLKNQTILLTKPKSKKNSQQTIPDQLSLLTFAEHRFEKSAKTVGLYAITEDFFERELNSIFCKDKQFIEAGTTLGFVNLEKEITGDIVQGLPRIEEILEARKKNVNSKSIPTSQKKGLLVHVNTLDSNFDFKKLGTTINENDKLNPHKFLKTYFNYYGVPKQFFCARKKTLRYNQLTNNYEGSYKAFKKVQLFILNSVQAVYKSQGVTINNKHLEVIVRQMTSKVLITYEGNAPLLRREVVDIYHIKYINKIVLAQKNEPANYVPLLLGITKSALNNPSFISAASFQETTRVLTRAAIEGRIDWLRGLKENIITGHLIPAGTGSPNYRSAFRQQRKIPTSLLLTKSIQK